VQEDVVLFYKDHATLVHYRVCDVSATYLGIYLDNRLDFCLKGYEQLANPKKKKKAR